MHCKDKNEKTIVDMKYALTTHHSDTTIKPKEKEVGFVTLNYCFSGSYDLLSAMMHAFNLTTTEAIHSQQDRNHTSFCTIYTCTRPQPGCQLHEKYTDFMIKEI